MKAVHKSVLIWFSPQEMYALVTEISQYPQFLPWCDHAHVKSVDGDTVIAEIGILFGGVRQAFTTENVNRPGQQVAIRLLSGPFSKLDGIWDFVPLGDGSQRACKVELKLSYGFDNATLAKIVGPVFDKIASSLIDAFVKRAQVIYGNNALA